MASAGSHIETEIKLRVPDAGAAHSLLDRLRYHIARPRVFESNILYDTEEHRLRQRGELVRVRQTGEAGLLTFKAADQSGRHKSREEFETLVADPRMLATILERIGFSVVFRYEKYRTEYRRGVEPGIVTLDETPIGTFLELEGDGGWIDNAAHELGFAESQYILLSYGALYRDYCARNPAAPAHMVFPPRALD